LSLVITNESDKHAGHSGNPNPDPSNPSETHFRVEVVSEAFAGKNLVARHRQVYALLGAELKGGVHALALKTKTPEEVGRAS
jgi:stress-induced morphogen